MISRAKLRAWYQASRPPFFIATLIPLGIGGRVAAMDGHWNGLLWAAIILASFFVHLNANLTNDYYEFDYDSTDSSIGGTRVLQQGLITIREMGIAIVLFYFLALLLGLYILFTSRAWLLILFIVFAALSSLYYTAPPLRYAYRGLGEVMVGLNMGPVMVAGTFLAMTGNLSGRIFLLSLPVAVGVAFILFYQSLSDMDVDKAAGKYTLAVRLGRKKIRSMVFIFAFLEYAGIALLIALRYLHPAAALSLLSLPFILKISSLLDEHKDWIKLHENGKYARFFYLFNGLIVLLTLI